MDLTLCPVGASNQDVVVLLCVDESQKGFVATNALSLVQTAYNAGHVSADGNRSVLSFTVWPLTWGMWGMWQLMIDKKHQRNKYGCRALTLLPKKLAQEKVTCFFYTSAKPKNGPSTFMSLWAFATQDSSLTAKSC